MKELAIVKLARSWAVNEGRMKWVSQSSGKSNLYAALSDAKRMPAGGFAPSEDWSLVCFEMPLLASLNVNAMTHWYTKKVIQNPAHYLKGHQLRGYKPGNALQGDLVFWKMKQKTNKLLSAFDRFGTSADTSVPFGLDHVALATGQLQGQESEVISFWESGLVEITTVGAITESVSRQFGEAEFDVSVSRGPWYWGYYLW